VLTWTVDVVAALLIVAVGSGYAVAFPRARRHGAVRCVQAASMGAALVVLSVATMSPVAVYSPLLFWTRALQVLLLLFVVPFLLASAMPVAVARAAVGRRGAANIDAALASRAARVLTSPAVTSAAMLATPWLLYETPWYLASLTDSTIGSVTRILLVLIGFGYFYARLQADPVPRRYSPLLSIGISVVESLADGLLGLVLWLGPLVAADYYAGLHRTFGPSLRTDQSIGAGILWILGDVLGIPFLLVLFRAFSVSERRREKVVDAAEDVDAAGSSAPWWESDPQLRERYGR
jgi:cytochrome c oxidase assembly factor CtaG